MKVWIGLSLLIFSYNNCGMQSGSDSNSAGPTTEAIASTGDLCEDDLLKLFSSGYHKFLKENCSICHAQGPGKGRFANADVKIAIQDFNEVGVTKVSTNATSTTHNPPYSGAQHIQVINELKLEWQKGQEDYVTCEGVGSVVSNIPVEDLITYELKAQTVPALNFDEEKEMTWVVNQDLSRINGTGDLPNFPGALVSIKISRHKTGGGDEYYSLRAPTFYSSQVDAHIKGMHVKINGMLLKVPTTFKYVDRDIRALSKNDATGLLTTGALVIPGITSAADRITLDFEDLKVVTLPPPQQPIKVNFGGAAVSWAPSVGDRIANIDIVLAEPPAEPISVLVIVDGSKICNVADPVDLSTMPGCLPQVASFVCPTNDVSCKAKLKLRRALEVQGLDYNRFNWNYKFKNTTVLFSAGEVKKTIQIKFSSDIRKEDNRLLSLTLEPGLGPVVLGANANKHFVIEKTSNPTPPVGVFRFQDLMQETNGILKTNCLKCHNSKDHQGNYDITNYEEMIARGVLIPGDTNSKMFRRINPSDPSWSPVFRMPQDGQMIQDYIDEVRLWIQAGAPNN